MIGNCARRYWKMSRLTKKGKTCYYPNVDNGSPYYPDSTNACRLIQIIGEYEDLEEQLGCPIDVVFRALKQGYVYVWFEEFDRLETSVISGIYSDYRDEWVLDLTEYENQSLQDYKKTWWLLPTKEE